MDCGDGLEREARFLVTDNWRERAVGAQGVDPGAIIEAGERLEQWYLTTDPARTVRVRRNDHDQVWLTVKGEKVGDVAPEYEFDLTGPPEKVDGLQSLRVGSV